MAPATLSKMKSEEFAKLEQALNEVNERLETLLNTLPIGIVIIDYKTQHIIDANPQALMTFGCSLDALLGKVCHEHICPADKGNCPIIDQGLALDRSEREIITTDNDRIPVLKSALKTSIVGKDVLLECFIDMRDKKLAEQEHLKREKLQSTVEMAGAVCHEFNQPLQILTGACDLLKSNDNLDEDAKDTISHMTQALDRMGTLTRNLSNITVYRTKDYMGSEIFDINESKGNLK